MGREKKRAAGSPHGPQAVPEGVFGRGGQVGEECPVAGVFEEFIQMSEHEVFGFWVLIGDL